MNRKWTITLVGIFMVMHNTVLFAQSNAGVSANIEPAMIIDKPTAGMLHRGNYYVSANFFEQGGVLVGVSVGLIDRFNFGISYGGTDILGMRKPEMNPYPGVNVKLRILEEVLLLRLSQSDSTGKDVDHTLTA